jgi:uncharacterized protein
MIATEFTQYAKMLECLDQWLVKGVELAAQRSFDPSVLLFSRLAPDQYALTRQVQAACDAAKTAAARLAGREPPRHPDDEVTMDEVRARIAKVLAYLKEFSPADFEGAATRVVPLPFIPGKGMLGADYLRELATPNFYFHITTAYSILRHNGVDLGKTVFIGSLILRDL